jgi:hypothetical protein
MVSVAGLRKPSLSSSVPRLASSFHRRTLCPDTPFEIRDPRFTRSDEPATGNRIRSRTTHHDVCQR